MGEILNTPQEKEEGSCSVFCKGPNSAHPDNIRKTTPRERRHNFCAAGALPGASHSNSSDCEHAQRCTAGAYKTIRPRRSDLQPDAQNRLSAKH